MGDLRTWDTSENTHGQDGHSTEGWVVGGKDHRSGGFGLSLDDGKTFRSRAGGGRAFPGEAGMSRVRRQRTQQTGDGQ